MYTYIGGYLLKGCIRRRRMLKRYAKYGLFLLYRDYLVVRATMMGNECFMITIYIYIYKTDSVILIRSAVNIFWFFLLSKMFLRALSPQLRGIEGYSPTIPAVTRIQYWEYTECP